MRSQKDDRRLLSARKRIGLGLAGIVLVAAVTVALVLAFAGSGNGLPASVAVRVGSQDISIATVQRWMVVAAREDVSTGAGAGAGTLLPDAPKFSACIASGRKTNEAKKGSVQLTTAELRAQCASAYEDILAQVMQLLVTANWVAQADSSRHIVVTPAQVSALYAQQLKASFPTTAAFNSYLQKSGLTIAQVLTQVQDSLLTEKLHASVIAGSAPVTSAQARSYYLAHRSAFASPQTRDLKLIFVKTAALASAPLKALASGSSWAVTAKKYSEDKALNKTGGVVTNVPADKINAVFAKAVFAAPEGVIEGPLSSVYGFAIYEVTAVHPPSQQSYTQAHAAVISTLTTQRQTKLLAAFTAAWKKTYKAETVCVRAYNVAAVCGAISK